MKGIYAISLLVVSNIFMTFAWYGHLKLQEMKVISNWPLYAVCFVLVDDSVGGVFISDSCQSHRVHRQWRSFFVDAA